jgi:hypothetical protein
VDRLVLPPEREIILGRDRECHVRYSEADELVSRKHLKIVAGGETPLRYMAVDLGSRNGTFVNRQRVFGAQVLSPGARVQLGAGGPEFEFQLDTEPESGRSRAKRTSVNADALRNRGVDLGRRALLISLPVAAGAAGAAGYVAWPRMARFWDTWHPARPVRRESTFDPHAALTSLVDIQAQWSVLHKPTHARLARAYIANERISGPEHVPLVEGAAKVLPAFVLQAGRRIEPLLVPVGNAHAGRSIGGVWNAKGVVVPQRQTTLVAAPVPLPWDTLYQWPAEESAGALLIIESARIKDIVPLSTAQFPRWAQSESGWLADELPADVRGEVRGHVVSRDELSVEMTAGIGGFGERLNMTTSMGSPAVLAAAMPSGAVIYAAGFPRIGGTSTPPAKGAAVWVVGQRVEAGEVDEVSSDGRITLRAAHCGEGRSVFDREGRLVALCVPEPNLASGGGSAVLVSHALGGSSGGADGQNQ